MNPPIWLAITMLVIAVIPLVMTLINLTLYRRSDPDAAWPTGPDGEPVRVFACVPARNEEENIGPCVRSLLAGGDEHVRVLIYDDQSSDRTPAIVRELAAQDPRVRSVETLPLPDGWNGKQHACWRMARAAIDGEIGEDAARAHDRLLFTDADVRFAPGALRRAAAEADRLGAGLLSTFPRQVTGSIGEHLVVPMMFYVLFGYLPMARMRRTNDPATSAGCGQFLLASVEAYGAAGGHESCRDSMHDGIKLPRAVRAAGHHTDLFDGTDLCGVRMYRGFGETWRGFTKNAFEGLGSVGLLVFITALHLVGHVLPWVFLIGWMAAAAGGSPSAEPVPAALVLLAIVAPIVQRLVLAARLRHSVTGAILHVVGVVLLTAIQWRSLVLHRSGKRAWRGRVLSAASSRSA